MFLLFGILNLNPSALIDYKTKERAKALTRAVACYTRINILIFNYLCYLYSFVWQYTVFLSSFFVSTIVMKVWCVVLRTPAKVPVTIILSVAGPKTIYYLLCIFFTIGSIATR